MTETILIIDDAADVRALLSFALKDAGYRVVEAESGPAGIEAYHAHQPDLILLDIGLGSMDGLEVCRQLRAVSSSPIIFLTSRADEVDQLVGFAAGGDDYVTKPFSPKVVVARVSSLLRRNIRTDSDVKTRFTAGPIVVDTESRMATLDGTPLDLTRTEFDLLTVLMENPTRVVTREILLERVWGEWFGDTHVVEVHMSRLRSKVKKAGGPAVGTAVRGVGYRLGVDSADA
jgi:DNA-binding response OmpR family regulator